MSDDSSSVETDITAFSDEEDFTNAFSSYSFGKHKMVYTVNKMNQDEEDEKIENVSTHF